MVGVGRGDQAERNPAFVECLCFGAGSERPGYSIRFHGGGQLHCVAPNNRSPSSKQQ